ncbi:uncharacterized protein LOC18035064 [Citrus clementina]|uniref:uncharacterized protein LOC18035064 n=1 Tax=Citrus clementina TaxID=85681 RepID=UPI000CED3D68|nr:uncharacterized protein LOC18035064 [Citrus x clementina]
MAVTIHNALPSLNALKSKSIIRNRPESRRVSANSVRCCQVATSDKQSITVSNGNDSLEICRVLNGMWQTSGGWGRIDRDDAVDAMLRYADAGLTTFDMADHCMSGKPYLKKERTLFVRITSAIWCTGKIKTVALTNFDTERLRIILENGIPVVSNQVQHSVVDMRPQQKMAELCQLTGVKLITYGTVMGGLLSEKFLDTNLSIPFAGPPLNTPSLQKYKRMVDAWGGWSQFQVLLQTLKRIASKHGVSIPVVAVRYILDQPAVAGSMIGVRLGLAEHIQDTNAIFMLSLDEDDVNSIQEVTKKGKDLLGVIGDCGDEYRR